MANIEESVVKLRLDNRNFTDNAEKTISALDRVKKALRLKGGTDGLQSVDAAAKKLDLSAISNGVDLIASRFSVMGLTAVSTLANITTRAIDTGVSLVKALSLDPIMAGFSEYETQINAVQTILANTSSKGTTLDQVNGALDQLNQYADKTIYNFTEMTRNIGTFTAAGVELDTSVQAIKGIANLAAVSGSNSQQASTAMYQLSQALSTGTVKLMDWNSVVNAGMGGQVFQDALMETARVHGVAIDDIIAQEGSFRDSLSKEWLSSDILLETLNKFTGDLNEEQLRSMGYTEDQIEEIIKLGQVANDAATKVKTVTQLFDTLKEAAQSGWTQTWEILFGDFEEAKELFTGISDVVSGFLNDSAKARNDVLQSWKSAGGRKDLIEGLASGFKALVEIVKPIRDAFREVFPPVTAQALIAMTKNFKEFTSSLKPGIETIYQIKAIAKGFFSILSLGVKILKSVGKAVKIGLEPLFSKSGGGQLLKNISHFSAFFTKLNESSRVMSILSKATNLLGSALKLVVTILIKATSGLSSFLSFVGGAAKPVVALLADIVSFFGGSFLSAIGATSSGLNRASESALNSVEVLKKSIIDFKDKSVSALKEFTGYIQSRLPKSRDSISRIGTTLSRLWENIKKMASGASLDNIIDVGKMGVLLVVARSIKKTFDTITGLFSGDGSIVDSFKSVVDGITGSLEGMQSTLKAQALQKIAIAVGVLAASAWLLSTVDGEDLAKAVSALGVIIIQMVGMASLMGKIDTASVKMTQLAASLVILGAAVLIMAASVKVLSKIPFTSLVKGLGGLGTILLMLLGFSKVLDKKQKSFVRLAKSMIILGVAVRILASSVSYLGRLDIASLGKGLLGLSGIMLTLAGLSKVMDGVKLKPSTAASILIMSVAIRILVESVKPLGSMDTSALTQGVIAVGVILGMLGLLSKFGSGNLALVGVGFLMVAGAMRILSSSIESLGSLNTDVLTQGLIALGVAMGIIAASSHLIPADMVAKAAGVLVMAVAIGLIATSISALGALDTGNVAQGVLALAATLAIIATAAYAMQGSVAGAAAIIIIAAAINLLVPPLILLSSLSLTSLGVALLALAGTFLVFGVAGAVLAPVVPAMFALAAALALIGATVFLVGAGVALLGIGLSAIGAAGAAAGVGLLAVAQVIPEIMLAVGEGFIGIIQVITENIPVIVALFLEIGNGILQVLTELIPPAVDLIFKLIQQLVLKITENIPILVDAGLKMVIGILSGIASNIGGIVDQAVNVIVNFVNGIRRNIDRVIQSGVDLIISLIEGIGKSIRNNSARLVSAAAQMGRDIIAGLGNAIAEGASQVWSALKGVLSDAWNSALEWLGIRSPSRRYAEMGKWMMLGAAKGITANAKSVSDSAINVAKETTDAFVEIISGLSDLVDIPENIQPVIRPILDDSDVLDGFKRISNGGGIVSGQLSLSRTIQTGQNGSPTEAIPGAPGEKTSLVFNQTINSPKPLSRIEIYRNTRNLLGASYA